MSVSKGTMPVMRHARTMVFAVTAAVLLSSCAANEVGDIPSDLSGTIDGAGSSAQAAAQEAWIAEFQHNNAYVTVNYDPTGSGAGREAFLAGAVDFAGSDAPLGEEELAGEFGACVPGTQGIDLPVYLSPLAVVFNVNGVDELNLDAETLARIFKGEITRWDDPSIEELNPDAELPSLRITAVHRSDDSGTTENFEDYLHQAAPDVWDTEPTGTFPYSGGEAAQGNSGVVSAVRNGIGTIGYADASKVGDLDVARLKVGDEFVDYTPEAAAAIADVSPLQEGRAPNDLAMEVDRTSQEAGVYPLVLVSYLILCQDYADDETAVLVKEYAGWVASDAGQAYAAEFAGSAPISDSLAEQVNAAIDSIE